MDLKIKYEELWELILKLPAKQLARLKEDLAGLSERGKVSPEKNNFQKFLLQGPVMTQEQDDQFEENRKYVNEWMKR